MKVLKHFNENNGIKSFERIEFKLGTNNGYVANALIKIMHPYRLEVFCEDLEINYVQE
jgi:hypothetical protein